MIHLIQYSTKVHFNKLDCFVDNIWSSIQRDSDSSASACGITLRTAPPAGHRPALHSVINSTCPDQANAGVCLL